MATSESSLDSSEGPSYNADHFQHRSCQFEGRKVDWRWWFDEVDVHQQRNVEAMALTPNCDADFHVVNSLSLFSLSVY
jgi:hypothetical protein